MAEDKYIQFVANYDDWVAIKKLKIEESTDPRIVMQFLASLGTSLDRKVEENLSRIVDLKKLDDILAEITTGKKEGDIARIIAEASSGKVNRTIGEICELPQFQTKEKKELQEFCKVYSLKKAFKEAGLYADYSKINMNIPGMRKRKTK